MCLWGFIRAKSCVARCRQLCARSSCEHAARAASQPVWVKPKSFQIPVPLKLDSLDYVMDFSRDPPISGTSETEKWDPYKIPTLKLGFPGISPFLNVSLAWMTFSHDSPTPGTIRATRCPENPRDSAIGQGVKGPIVIKLLRNGWPSTSLNTFFSRRCTGLAIFGGASLIWVRFVVRSMEAKKMISKWLSYMSHQWPGYVDFSIGFDGRMKWSKLKR